ncbi:MAG: hypothetical protein HQK76_08270 [Desulfobacterales bacterium]|nr:hypothetical protein [Desulfobacterales bacterium]
MSKNLDPKNIDQLMAEAEELIQQFNSDAIKDIKEEHRLQFEKHAHNLKKIKSKILGKTENKDAEDISSNGEGIHNAIQDIVKAIKDLKSYLL